MSLGIFALKIANQARQTQQASETHAKIPTRTSQNPRQDLSQEVIDYRVADTLAEFFDEAEKVDGSLYIDVYQFNSQAKVESFYKQALPLLARLRKHNVLAAEKLIDAMRIMAKFSSVDKARLAELAEADLVNSQRLFLDHASIETDLKVQDLLGDIGTKLTLPDLSTSSKALKTAIKISNREKDPDTYKALADYIDRFCKERRIYLDTDSHGILPDFSPYEMIRFFAELEVNTELRKAIAEKFIDIASKNQENQVLAWFKILIYFKADKELDELLRTISPKKRERFGIAIANHGLGYRFMLESPEFQSIINEHSNSLETENLFANTNYDLLLTMIDHKEKLEELIGCEPDSNELKDLEKSYRRRLKIESNSIDAHNATAHINYVLRTGSLEPELDFRSACRILTRNTSNLLQLRHLIPSLEPMLDLVLKDKTTEKKLIELYTQEPELYSKLFDSLSRICESFERRDDDIDGKSFRAKIWDTDQLRKRELEIIHSMDLSPDDYIPTVMDKGYFPRILNELDYKFSKEALEKIETAARKSLRENLYNYFSPFVGYLLKNASKACVEDLVKFFTMLPRDYAPSHYGDYYALSCLYSKLKDPRIIDYFFSILPEEETSDYIPHEITRFQNYIFELLSNLEGKDVEDTMLKIARQKDSPFKANACFYLASRGNEAVSDLVFEAGLDRDDIYLIMSVLDLSNHKFANSIRSFLRNEYYFRDERQDSLAMRCLFLSNQLNSGAIDRHNSEIECVRALDLIIKSGINPVNNYLFSLSTLYDLLSSADLERIVEAYSVHQNITAEENLELIKKKFIELTTLCLEGLRDTSSRSCNDEYADQVLTKILNNETLFYNILLSASEDDLTEIKYFLNQGYKSLGLYFGANANEGFKVFKNYERMLESLANFELIFVNKFD